MHVLTSLLLAATALSPAMPDGAVHPRLGDHPPPYLVRDLGPGREGRGPDPALGLLAMGDLVLNGSTRLLSPPGTPPGEQVFTGHLIRSDGTAPGTFELLPGERALYDWFPADDRMTFLMVGEGPFGGDRGIPPAALWRTDGTVEGTIPLTDFGALHRAIRTPFARYLDEAGALLFLGRDPSVPEADWELWASDGTREGTGLLKDLWTGGSSLPRSFFELDGAVYFFADTGEGIGWGVSDGTAAGTRLLPNPRAGEATPVILAPGPDAVFLFLWIPETEHVEVWRSDGTPGGASLLANLGEIGRDGVEVEGVAGERLYFFVDDRPPLTSQPRDVVLWSSDGTVEGTGPVPRPAGAPFQPEGPWRGRSAQVGSRTYFALDDGVHGLEPWVTDGTAAGTRMIADVCPGPEGSFIAGYGELQGSVYFLAYCPQGPRHEPWLWHPETDELRELGDLCPGECVATGGIVAETGGRAYLQLDDEIRGPELWVTDATATGTEPVSDFQETPHPFRHQIIPGLTASGSYAITAGRLFFGANDAEHGWELWALPIPGAGGDVPPPPPGDPLTSPELPGYAVRVRIDPGSGEPIEGRAEPACIPETLCVSGAVPGRSELFVRIVGPKPNGFLWPTLVKFSTSTVEVWIEQLETGMVRHYRLEGASPGSSELPGLFDRDGFRPD